MLSKIKKILNSIRTLLYCYRSGLKYDKTWSVRGRVIIIKMPYYVSKMRHLSPGKLIIGKNFHCSNIPSANSIGTIQPCVFDYAKPNSIIEIGDNVGITGSTINASCCIKIGNNVLIGSGCLITDTDSHPINWKDRISNDDSKTKSKPIVIEDNVFIGARSIILKGVTIGRCSIVGAGSVVTQSIPPNVIACGNPAKVVKKLNIE